MRIFFSVGEPSGDVHGANLIRELTRQHSDCVCVGFGGPKMVEAGFHLHADLTKLAVMWFLRAILNIHRFAGLLWQADRHFRNERPDAVVLIDYPGFNWWIARRAKAHGIPVFYYGAPQMWAWASWRISKMRRLVDHVLCKLPFEAKWYQERQCNATFVGHPFFDQTEQYQVDEEFLVAQRVRQGRLVTMLPGSRMQEVTANLSAFLKTARLLHAQQPDLRFAIAAFNGAQALVARESCQDLPMDVEVHIKRTPELIQAATVCLACSGSVSLELLHYKKPTVIHYRVNRLAFFVQRYFRKVRFITLVNLLSTDDRYCDNGELYDATRDNVPYPEYLTSSDVAETMAADLIRWLDNDDAIRATQQKLNAVRQLFPTSGASRTAAEYILHHLALKNTVGSAQRQTIDDNLSTTNSNAA